MENNTILFSYLELLFFLFRYLFYLFSQRMIPLRFIFK